MSQWKRTTYCVCPCNVHVGGFSLCWCYGRPKCSIKLFGRIIISWAPRARSAAPWVRKFGNLPILEILVITWPYARPTVRPHHRYTNVYSHTFWLLWEPREPRRKLICTSMLWSIDSCQNKVSADQYHLTVLRGQVSTHPGRVFFDVIRWHVTGFQMIAGSSLNVKFHKNCDYTGKILKISCVRWNFVKFDIHFLGLP